MKYWLAALPMRLLDEAGLAPRPARPAAFVIERGNWSIKWDGHYVTRGVNAEVPGFIETVDRPWLLARRVVHFGSQFQWNAWNRHLPRSNAYSVNFFHGKREDDPDMARHVDAFLETLPRLSKVVTAASLIERRLLGWGVPREKLVRIPIGVDLSLFRPASAEQRMAARLRIGAPEGSLVIGSFQKDGNGWGEGLDPKLIKGPDVFLDAVARVAKERQVFVFLTGPARGYVRRGLERLGIPHRHEMLENYLELPARFHALDVYVNPSREEGGPKGILEAAASAIPVATTAVGMAPDVFVDGISARMTPVAEPQALAQAILDCADAARAPAYAAGGLRAVQSLGWDQVANRYWKEVFQPLAAGMAKRP
jgi:glycosyltransferase involved in cell wall biosynthesis